MRILTMAMVAALVSAASGCGGGLDTSLEGVYSLTTWTENTGGCAAEGASVLDQHSDTAAYVKVESFFGHEFLNVVTCADEGACATEAASDTLNFGSWAFESGSDGDGWTGTSSFASGDPTTCTGAQSKVTMTHPTATTIRIEVRTNQPVTFPPNDAGECTTDDAERLSADAACGTLEVVTATFAADI